MAIQVDKNQVVGVQRSTRGSGDENTAKKCKNHDEMSWAEKYASNIKDTRSNSQVRFKKGSPHTVFELQRERELPLKFILKKQKENYHLWRRLGLCFHFLLLRVCVLMCVHDVWVRDCVHATVLLRRSGHNVWSQSSSSTFTGLQGSNSGDQVHTKHLYLMGHLASP